MSSRLQNLVDEVLRCAMQRRLTISTAESCSGGTLATAFAKGEGAATHFIGGVVSYTKEGKTNLLGVPASLLAEKTAVCAEVAEAMALGVVSRSGASLGVSITGVAGPREDEDSNPVGLIYCGMASSVGKSRHVRLELASKEPDENVNAACVAAAELLLSFCISGNVD
jgi:PncC family amidohydrolase